MATFGELPLFDSGVDRSGAVFILAAPSPVTVRQGTTRDTFLQLTVGSDAAVVHGLAASNGADVLITALHEANRALDLLAARNIARLVLAPLTRTIPITWCEETGLLILRLIATSVSRFSFSTGVPAPALGSQWHTSMRYWRMSQVTDDLYDAFRNLFLALESLLGHLAPMRMNSNGRPESEGYWLRRAIRVAGCNVDLNRYLLNKSVTPDVDLFHDLWTDVRNKVFHAKTGQPILTPLDTADRNVVAEAHERYGRLYLDLADYALGVRFISGGITVGGFAQSSALNGVTIQMTDDPAPASINDTTVSPSGHAVLQLPTARTPEHDSALLSTVLGSVSGDDARRTLQSVRRFGATRPGGSLVVIHSLDLDLTLEGIDHIECLLQLQAVNVTMPKTDYST